MTVVLRWHNIYVPGREPQLHLGCMPEHAAVLKENSGLMGGSSLRVSTGLERR